MNKWMSDLIDGIVEATKSIWFNYEFPVDWT